MALRQASMTESTVTLPPVSQGVAIVPSYRVYLFDRANHTRPMKTSNIPAIKKPSKRRRNLWIAMTWSFGKEVAL